MLRNTTAFLLAVTCLVGPLSSCNDVDRADVPTPDDSDDTSMGDDVDASTPESIEVRFVAQYRGKRVACGHEYALGSAETTAELRDLRFYVSDVRLLTRGGKSVPLQLDANDFQVENVALVDLEDASGACSATGTTQLNDVVVGQVPRGDYVGLTFGLGVPFELNHGDLNTAPPPLNISNLFWNWLPGHKFARIDLKPTEPLADGGAPLGWNFHLGSTLCMQDVADGGTVNPQAPPSTRCDRPNLPTYSLDGFDTARDVVVLDLEALFARVDISTNLGGSTPGCMSFPPDEPDCAPLFESLGMEFETGECVDGCSDQSIFSVR